MLELIKSFMPVQVERVCGTITGAVGVVSSYLFGAWNAALEALVTRERAQRRAEKAEQRVGVRTPRSADKDTQFGE